MNILFYCQHVLGVGHYFRSIEICKALSNHSVTLVLGGPAENLPLPEGAETVQLPCLMMDRDFSELSACDSGKAIEAVKLEREKQLVSLIQNLSPDIFIIELYPFGRKAFRFELEPAIKAARQKSCKIICSLRDILVEKSNQEKYEARVLNILNSSFDGLLVHSDPSVLPLSKTFMSVDKITIPLVYTGFVTRHLTHSEDRSFKAKIGLHENSHLIIASAGSGAVGHSLLQAVINCLPLIKCANIHLIVFTGPYMSDPEYQGLKGSAHSQENIEIHRFTNEFISYLLAADLSISMAGYNTCMNIMATGTPSLMWPFAQNREQRMRAELLGGPISVLDDHNFNPEKLAGIIDTKLKAPREKIPKIDLDGAKNSAAWLTHLGEN